MIKKIFAVFMMAMLFTSLPFIVHADFANRVQITAYDSTNGDYFGKSVSISGDTAIIGAYQDASYGTAYVYVRNPDTDGWNIQTKIYPSLTEREGSAWFGTSVALSGDTAIIGASRKDDDVLGSNAGAAYVFVRDAQGRWSEQQKLLASDGGRNQWFGHAISISGNTAIIGAHGNSSAYVFVRNPDTGIWTEQQKLLASDLVFDDRFGASVFIEGDLAIIGAAGDDTPVDGAGAAYIFVRDPDTGIWTEQQKLLASDGGFFDGFGSAVSINNGTAIVGAGYAGGADAGAAYVFVRDDPGVWTEQQKLEADSAWLSLGLSVALTGDIAIAGSEGGTYVFVRDNQGVWAQDQILAVTKETDSISISGNRMMIGAPFDNFGQGIAYVYTETGIVINLPDITVTDSVAPNSDLQIPFGDVTELAYSNQTVTVTNDGVADLSVGNIAVADVLATPFTIETDNCSGQVLTPAANCNITVKFSPASTGNFSDSFDIPSDDADENPVTVSVDGTGVGLPVPDIRVTDSIAPIGNLAIEFGNVTELTISDQTVTISNDGNANLPIGNIADLDVLVAPFSILNDACSNTGLAAAASCTLTVRFEPTGAGIFDDSFDIPSDDADEPSVTFNVSGTGTIPVADITVTDAIAPANDLQIPFADLSVAGTSDQTVTITNEGNAALAIGNVAEANVLAAPFSVINDNCSGQTLAATASCTLVVRFAPTTAGIFNDSFDIPSDDPDEASVTVNVSATGIAARLSNPPSTPGLVSPANGRQILGTSVLLEWSPATDPDSDALSYDVYNCTDSDPLNNCSRLAEVASLNQDLGVGISYASLGLGGGFVILGITFAGGLRNRRQTVLLIVAIAISALLASCGGGDGDNYKTYRVSGLDTETTYYWAVVAKDGNGGETSSVVWSYSTQ